jgi:hypothetical protein
MQEVSLLVISDLREKLEAVNRLLEKVYSEPIRLSNILLMFGVPPEELTIIKKRWAPQLSDAVIDAVRSRFSSLRNGERDFFVLSNRLGLGSPACSLKNIAEKLALSRERIRQLEERAIRRCRTPKTKLTVESYLKESLTVFRDSNKVA